MTIAHQPINRIHTSYKIELTITFNPLLHCMLHIVYLYASYICWPRYLLCVCECVLGGALRCCPEIYEDIK